MFPLPCALGVLLAAIVAPALAAGPSPRPATELRESVHADLPRLLDPLPSATARFEAFQAGGGGTVTRPSRILRQASLEAGEAGVVVRFEAGGTLEATVAALGLPTDWQGFAYLEVEGTPDTAGTLELAVVGARSVLAASAELEAGKAVRLRTSLADLPLTAGIRALYEPAAVRLRLRAGNGRLQLHALRLAPLPAGADRRVVDRFGQRRNASWPGKVLSLGDLRARSAAEASDLAAHPAPVARDRFGGWTGGPRFAASGYFRVERDGNGRWWFVSPEGNTFWSLGATGVRVSFPTDTTPAAGREFLFEELPEPGTAEGSAWMEGHNESAVGVFDLPGNVHFYRWNVLRKHGTLEAWRDRVLDRWHAWGLNTFGAWCEEIMLRQERVVFTRFLRARNGFDGIPTVNGFADVFDPAWEAAVDRRFAQDTAADRGNPWLLGYFVDNEAHWRSMGLLDMPADARLREAWLAWVRGQHPDPASFNQAWGTTCASWDDIKRLTPSDLPATPALRERMAGFEALYAERYFSTVARLLRRHAPQHLYLGCRFVRIPPEAGIVAAAGRHVDVLSVNCYSRVPDPAAFEAWHRMAGGRPILIGEHHFPLSSPRQLPPLYEAFDAPERAAMYGDFVRTWARQPWSVGCHWYQHADQPLTGRHTDGENQTVGLVDITDTPQDTLVAAVRAAADQVYDWHAAPEAPPAAP